MSDIRSLVGRALVGRALVGRALVGRALAALGPAGWWLAAAATAVAASPSPGSAGGDPRSSGQGPGLVGDPLLAVGAVLAIGIGAVILTLAYVRLTSRSGH